MGVHGPAFVVIQPSGLFQEFIGDAQFAQTVQESGNFDFIAIKGAYAQAFRKKV